MFGRRKQSRRQPEPVWLKDPRPEEPILPEGEYSMKVIEVTRRISKGSGYAFWRVTFQPLTGPRIPVYIMYSENPQARWKVLEDFGSWDGLIESLDEVYEIEVTHEVYRQILRMRGKIVHDKPRDIVVTFTVDHAGPLPPGEYTGTIKVVEEWPPVVDLDHDVDPGKS